MLILSLECLTGGSGALAQSTNGWNSLTSQKVTLSATWTKLNANSSTGMVLGQPGATSYYYITDHRNFTNSTAGGSGLKIQGTVYLYIPKGLTITCQGANASGTTGAGAGIELSEGNTLYIIGSGDGAGGTTVTARGGNAANGGNGGNGGNAAFLYDKWIEVGEGGNGGNGGGGAGAGIGTRGGNGGTGGAGGERQHYTDWAEHNGLDGHNGTGGETAGNMGTLNVDQTFGIKVVATGGIAGTSGGSGGSAGSETVDDDVSKNYSMSGGGGGGGGGFGGAANDIGTGGPGGGGGGGGSAGSQDKASGGYDRVGCKGGSGGQNANSSWAGAGSGYTVTGNNRGYYQPQSGKTVYFNENSSNDTSPGDGGSGKGCGSSSTAGTARAGRLEYTITYHHVMPTVKTTTVKYSPSTGATVILPKNEYDGYQWALGIYGKDCRATGDASEFTTATKQFFGGNIDATVGRTIPLKDVYGDIDFYEVSTVCKLKNSGSNDQVLGDFFFDESNPNVNAPKWPITVRLMDRTLYKDDNWNTICLPFDMTPEQYSASPLAGATIKKLSDTYTGYYPEGGTIGSVTYNHAVVFLNFVDVEPGINGLQRGKPYLVKWSSGANLVDDTTEPEGEVPSHQLDFNNVMVRETVPGAWEGNASYSGSVTFQGTFSSTQLAGGDKTKLILCANNKLYYPSTKLSVAACRGYFIIPAQAANAREIVMGFDDDETTSIHAVQGSESKDQDSDTYFNLKGQRLTTPKKGINIVNGKKVVVK